jgi:peptide-methionine (S)-S-oxide reductase
MNKSIAHFVLILLLGSAVVGLGLNINSSQASSNAKNTERSAHTGNLSKAIFAGGCFWCIEADFEKLPGVNSAVSGYTGGAADTANYKQVSYTETGHYEAVEVSYDSNVVSYAELVEYFWRHIDPTDPEGQFCDKGSSYRSAIFYGSDQEEEIVNKSLENLRVNKPFDEDIVTAVLSAQPFYDAEEYHQDYYKKNPIRYKYYRNGCRRDNTVNRLWGSEKD